MAPRLKSYYGLLEGGHSTWKGPRWQTQSVDTWQSYPVNLGNQDDPQTKRAGKDSREKERERETKGDRQRQTDRRKRERHIERQRHRERERDRDRERESFAQKIFLELACT